MSYVGAFATSDLGPELLVVMSIHRPPRDIVKLCRLSDGHRFSLSPARVNVLDNGSSAFEDHMYKEVKKFRLAPHQFPSAPTRRETCYGAILSEYIRIIEETSANYRNMALITYIIQKEFERSYFPSYTTVDCWQHVYYVCQLHDIAPPTISVVRSRLHQFANQYRTAFIGLRR